MKKALNCSIGHKLRREKPLTRFLNYKIITRRLKRFEDEKDDPVTSNLAISCDIFKSFVGIIVILSSI